MDHVRLGIAGVGGIAQHHLGSMPKVKRVKLAALADTDPKVLAENTAKHNVPGFGSAAEMLDSGAIDAVLICTPHYDHPKIAIEAFKRNIHVLTEKPVAVTAKAAQEANEAHAKCPKVVYAAMFNQRTHACWKLVKQMMDGGEVGEMLRVQWTITNWFRTQSYYNSGGWRATWQGEGGGVLINQCPHNLDLFQWFVGMPTRCTAQVGLGKFHNIEVEDEVTALLEYANGATGVFITSTGEAPGTNRLEIVGDNGRLVTDGRGVEFLRNTTPTREFCANSPERFSTPGTARYDITPAKMDEGHHLIVQNFVDAILDGTPLIAPAEEGIRGLELGNAMLMSGVTKKPVNLPTDREAYDQMLQGLIANSTFVKPQTQQVSKSFAGSF